MYIKKAEIISFGGIKGREYDFTPDMNVISGPNESGKSTLQQFIVAMLFGLEKKKGNAKDDPYRKYEPWDSPSYYCGRLTINVDGKDFLIERNFYYKEKSCRIVSLSDNEELSEENGDLKMLLGNISRSAFENTCCIGQMRQKPDSSLSETLRDEKSSLIHTGEAGFSITAVVGALEDKRKAIEKSLKDVKGKREGQLYDEALRSEMLYSEAGRLKGRIAEAEAEALAQGIAVSLASSGSEGLEGKTRKTSDVEDSIAGKNFSGEMDNCDKAQKSNMDERESCSKEQENSYDDEIMGIRKRYYSPVLIVGIVGCMLTKLVQRNSNTGVPDMVFTVLMIVFAILVVIGLALVVKKRKDKADQENAADRRLEAGLHTVEERAADTRYEDMEAFKRAEQIKGNIAALRSELAEKEALIANAEDKMAELEQAGEEEQELTENLGALELARSTIENISNDMAEDADDSLNQRMSEILSAITGGCHDNVTIDEKKGVLMTETADSKARTPESYSFATMAQVYLAYRLAAGEYITRNETMPLIFDEAFVGYDDARLKNVMDWLAEQKGQKILFTSRNTEAEK